MTRHSEPVDPDHYRKAIGRLATGVSVVTAKADGIDHAMTVNSLTSVSLEPVLMLVSVEREARFYDAIMNSPEWGVSILTADAQKTAAWLATRGRPLHGQLDRVAHHRGARTGMALLDDALAEFECRTLNTLDAGDHTLVIGEVLSIAMNDDPGDALTYYRGGFGRLI